MNDADEHVEPVRRQLVSHVHYGKPKLHQETKSCLKWAGGPPRDACLIRTHVVLQATTRDARPRWQAPSLIRAKCVRRLRKLMQQRRIPNRFWHPCQRALIRRQQPDVQFLNADPGV